MQAWCETALQCTLLRSICKHRWGGWAGIGAIGRLGVTYLLFVWPSRSARQRGDSPVESLWRDLYVLSLMRCWPVTNSCCSAVPSRFLSWVPLQGLLGKEHRCGGRACLQRGWAACVRHYQSFSCATAGTFRLSVKPSVAVRWSYGGRELSSWLPLFPRRPDSCSQVC
jgi:hypothetical protein